MVTSNANRSLGRFGEAIDQLHNSFIPWIGHSSRSYPKELGCHFVQNSGMSNNGNNPESQSRPLHKLASPALLNLDKPAKQTINKPKTTT